MRGTEKNTFKNYEKKTPGAETRFHTGKKQMQEKGDHKRRGTRAETSSKRGYKMGRILLTTVEI